MWISTHDDDDVCLTVTCAAPSPVFRTRWSKCAAARKPWSWRPYLSSPWSGTAPTVSTVQSLSRSAFSFYLLFKFLQSFPHRISLVSFPILVSIPPPTSVCYYYFIFLLFFLCFLSYLVPLLVVIASSSNFSYLFILFANVFFTYLILLFFRYVILLFLFSITSSFIFFLTSSYLFWLLLSPLISISSSSYLYFLCYVLHLLCLPPPLATYSSLLELLLVSSCPLLEAITWWCFHSFCSLTPDKTTVQASTRIQRMTEVSTRGELLPGRPWHLAHPVVSLSCCCWCCWWFGLWRPCRDLAPGCALVVFCDIGQDVKDKKMRQELTSRGLGMGGTWMRWTSRLLRRGGHLCCPGSRFFSEGYVFNKDTRKNFHTGANTHIHTQLSTDRYSPPLLSNVLAVTKWSVYLMLPSGDKLQVKVLNFLLWIALVSEKKVLHSSFVWLPGKHNDLNILQHMSERTGLLTRVVNLWFG